MNKHTTLAMLSALAQETRLDIFRLLVRAGQRGLAASTISQRLHIPASTCSFHLKELKQGGVVTCCRSGRSRCYQVDFPAMQSTLGYLMEACCTETTERDPNIDVQ